jgi:predicted ATPase
LLEREQELQAIEALLEDARAGHGSLLVFSGPAGVGKSSLLETAVRAAGRRGFTILRGSGGELERDSAFGVVRQLFAPLLSPSSPERDRQLMSGPAVRAAPVLGLDTPEFADGVVDTFAALHGLHYLVLNLEVEGPILLAIDDLQWADDFSQQLVAYLTRRLGDSRVAVVVGARALPSTCHIRDGARTLLFRVAARAPVPPSYEGTE